MKKTIKLVRITPLLSLCLLSGCLPWPHTSPRSQAVWGRVLDAQTHTPIQGAKIYLVQPPEHATYTDKNGYFYMKSTKNFHWAYVPPDGDGWPANKDNTIAISSPGYESNGGPATTNGDIFLTPKP